MLYLKRPFGIDRELCAGKGQVEREVRSVDEFAVEAKSRARRNSRPRGVPLLEMPSKSPRLAMTLPLGSMTTARDIKERKKQFVPGELERTKNH